MTNQNAEYNSNRTVYAAGSRPQDNTVIRISRSSIYVVLYESQCFHACYNRLFDWLFLIPESNCYLKLLFVGADTKFAVRLKKKLYLCVFFIFHFYLREWPKIWLWIARNLFTFSFPSISCINLYIWIASPLHSAFFPLMLLDLKLQDVLRSRGKKSMEQILARY